MTRPTTGYVPLSSLPPDCIRGPEIRDVPEVERHITDTGDDALAEYERGIRNIGTVKRLLAQRAKLDELRQTRDFLLRQLDVLERTHPEEFARALLAFDQQQASPPAAT